MTYAPVSCFRSTRGSSSAFIRRSFVRLGGAVAATGLLARTGHADARQAPPLSVPEPFDGDAFAGETSDPNLFVALVIGADEAGRGSGFIDPVHDLARPTEELYGFIDPVTDL